MADASRARSTDFFDWDYAKKAWYELRTLDQLNAEDDKYSADFDPWMALWKKNKRAAIAELKTYPDQKRRNIEHGYDLQLAYDAWVDGVYGSWFHDHKAGNWGSGRTFDQELAESAKQGQDSKDCLQVLTLCGDFPDWRSPKRLAEEKAMEAQMAPYWAKLGHY